MAATLLLKGWVGGTLNLNDGVNYALGRDWRPKVAPRRRSLLAGGGPHADVEEEIPLRVFGAGHTATMGALAALIDAVDQAMRARQGEAVATVTLEYLPSGSGFSGNLIAPVWGIPDREMTQLPMTFNEDINAWEISPITLRLWRVGDWLGTVDAPAATGAATHPHVFSVTFDKDTGHRLSPVSLRFSGFSALLDAAGNEMGLSAYLLTAGHADRIRVLEAEAGTATAPGSGTFSTATDTDASGGNIRRLQPVSAGAYTLRWSGLNFAIKSEALYVAMVVLRNNSTSIRYTISAEYGTFVPAATPPVMVDTSSQKPRVILLPVMAYPQDMQQLQLRITPSGTSGSGNQLDIDAAALLQITGPAENVALLTRINYVSQLSEHNVEIDDRAATHFLPVARQYLTGNNYRIGYQGNIRLLSSGDRIAACLVGTSDIHWRPMNGMIGSGPTVISSAMTAARRMAWRVPGG